MQPRQAMALVLCLGLAACEAHAATGKAEEFVYIGTHGAGGRPAPGAGSEQDAGSPQGIYAARLDTRTGHLSALGLAVGLQRATWLVIHPSLPVVYSVAQSPGGMAADSNIYSFAIDAASGTLRQMNTVDAGGHDATHMDLDPQSKTLFSANYGSGSVTALPLQPDGTLGPVVSEQKDYGTGPHPRQKSSVAHGVAIDPTRRWVLVADFGADRVFVYRWDGGTRKLTPAAMPFEALPPGSGPRHLLFNPNGRILYVNSELSGELRSYHWDPGSGRLQLVQTLSPYPADYSGEKSGAEIAISRDGRHLYLSLRGGQDTLIAYSTNEQSGSLTEIQRIASQGRVPWSFGIDPSGHWMLVTNETSNSVNVLRIDTATGKLAATSESLSIPNPVAVAFYAH
jgi:6-phosphogluconolactonase